MISFRIEIYVDISRLHHIIEHFIKIRCLEDRELASELNALANLEKEAVVLTIRKLQLEAIRFSRYSLLQILDGYRNFRIDSQEIIPKENL